MGLRLAYEKGAFAQAVVWIGTHLTVYPRTNKVEVRLPAKKNAEILEILAGMLECRKGMVRADAVRQLAGKAS